MAFIGGARPVGGSRAQLPSGVRSRSLGVGGSCVASWGGLVSTNTGQTMPDRKPRGPIEALTKASYAMALQEQIAARDAIRAESLDSRERRRGGAEPEESSIATPWSAPAQRHVGPVAVPTKEAYAAELQNQIAAREAQRVAERRSASRGPSTPDGPAAGAKEAPRGRRYGPPLLPSKDAYAMDLQEQIMARDVQRLQEKAEEVEAAAAAAAAQEDAASRNRRRGPHGPMAKSSYAAALDEQIAARDLAAQQEAAEDAAWPAEAAAALAAGSGIPGEAEDLRRGKRHATKIEQVSRSAYSEGLRQQIAAREADRAAEAYHAQAASEASPSAGDVPRGGRRPGPGLPLSKEAYASSLQEQIIARKAHQQGLHMEQPESVSSAIFGSTKSGLTAGPRGRRHVDQMQPLSKQALAAVLQGQMAERHTSHRSGSCPPPGAGNMQVSWADADGGELSSPLHADALERFLRDA